VPQRPRLFAGTFADNVRLGAPHASDDRVRRALEDAGLGDLVRAMPRGIETAVGEGGRRLSLGEARRVAIARAFARDAAVVVLDEPTANLDPASAAAVTHAVRRLCAGRTTLLITHDPLVAAGAQRTVTLVDGRLRDQTPPAEAMAA